MTLVCACIAAQILAECGLAKLYNKSKVLEEFRVCQNTGFFVNRSIELHVLSI